MKKIFLTLSLSIAFFTSTARSDTYNDTSVNSSQTVTNGGNTVNVPVTTNPPTSTTPTTGNVWDVAAVQALQGSGNSSLLDSGNSTNANNSTSTGTNTGTNAMTYSPTSTTIIKRPLPPAPPLINNQVIPYGSDGFNIGATSVFGGAQIGFTKVNSSTKAVNFAQASRIRAERDSIYVNEIVKLQDCDTEDCDVLRTVLLNRVKTTR